MNFDEVLLESEMQTLISLGDYINKQILLESYYMEDEVPQQQPQEGQQQQNSIQGVSKWEQFKNWLYRFCEGILRSIRNWFANGELKKAKETVQQNQNKQGFIIPTKLLESVNFQAKNNWPDFNIDIAYNPANVEKYKAAIQRSKDNKYVAEDYYGNGDLTKSEYKRTAQVAMEFLNNAEQYINKSNELMDKMKQTVKDQKSQLSEEVTKSNEFQLYVQWLTFSMKAINLDIVGIQKAIKSFNHEVGNVTLKDIQDEAQQAQEVKSQTAEQIAEQLPPEQKEQYNKEFQFVQNNGGSQFKDNTDQGNYGVLGGSILNGFTHSVFQQYPECLAVKYLYVDKSKPEVVTTAKGILKSITITQNNETIIAVYKPKPESVSVKTAIVGMGILDNIKKYFDNPDSTFVAKRRDAIQQQQPQQQPPSQ